MPKVGETCKGTFEKLQKVYKEDCMSRTQVYEWFKRFKDGRESVESDERSGRLLTSKTDHNVELVRAAVQIKSPMYYLYKNIHKIIYVFK